MKVFGRHFVSTLIQILISWALSLTIHCMHISTAAIIHICSVYLHPDRGDLSLRLRLGPFAVTQPVHKLTHKCSPGPKIINLGRAYNAYAVQRRRRHTTTGRGREASVFLAFNDSSWAGKKRGLPPGAMSEFWVYRSTYHGSKVQGEIQGHLRKEVVPYE